MKEDNPTVVFLEPGKVVIERRTIPLPEKGYVLIKTRRTLISTGTELTILSGEFPKESYWSRYARFPFVPGYDNVGEVVAVGEEVNRDWIGKRVATRSSHALFVTVPMESLIPISDQISDDQAAFFTIAEIVTNGVRRADVRLGESVAVYGAGLLGQFTARVCRLCGARPVFVIDIADARLGMLPKDPSVIGLNPTREDVRSVVQRETMGRMVDVAFEVTGNQKIIPEEFRCMRDQGRFVLLSSPKGPTMFDFHDLCNYPSYTIIGAHNRSHPPVATPDNPWTNRRHAELFFDLVADKELDISPLVTHRLPYDEAPAIYRQLLEDRSEAMGVILIWHE